MASSSLDTMFHLFNVFAAVFLFSRSSLVPMISLRALSYYQTLFLSLFNHPFYVFLLLNSIILFLYALSNNHNSSNNSNDLYHEFLTNSTIISTDSVPSANTIIPQQKTTVTAALHFSSENRKPVRRTEVVAESPQSPDIDRTVTAVTTTRETTTTACPTAATTTTTAREEKVSGEKCYRRVRSESYERRAVVAGSGGAELRRVSTGRLRRQGRLCHVEQLNKEEFNRAVEDFIAKQKRMLWEEQNQSHKPHNLAF